MKSIDTIIIEIELHNSEGIKKCFEAGVDPNVTYNDEPLINELISEYTRSPRFKDCVKVFCEYGLELNDQALLAVLCDDAAKLNSLITKDNSFLDRKYIFRCAYTPFYKVSLLHICAEFNHISCAKVLIQHGLDIDIAAGIDENGFGGQTPVFHTVNQNNNQSWEMMNYLLSINADLDITVKGFIWGKGYDWETLIPSVNPISYAMMGLLPQMHRDEKIVADTISKLLKHKYNISYIEKNLPNKYLQ